jgi:large subunit ribosomal protein L11
MAQPKVKGKGKEIKANLTVQVAAGQANPAPPLGPILGQNGINIQEFCTQFNDKTKDQMGDVLPVRVTVYKDNSFAMLIKQPTVAGMIKKAIKLDKGSANPKKDKVGKITQQQILAIAERKLPDLNTSDLDAAANIVAGTARSLGVEVV